MPFVERLPACNFIKDIFSSFFSSALLLSMLKLRKWVNNLANIDQVSKYT